MSDIPKFGVAFILRTLKFTIVAMASVVLGVGAAVYVSQYAGARTREITEPVVELLAGIPVVLRFFALMVMATGFRTCSTSSRGSTRWCRAWRCIAVIPVIFTLSEEAARRAAQLRRSIDRARRRALADH